MADPPRRVNFFDGMLLTAADLAVEQQYHREMRYLHNRLHGFGTVSGLEVSVGRGRVRVEPGLAIDRCGREIVVTSPLTLRLEPPGQARRWVRDVVIRWHETPAEPVPGPQGATEHTRWVEQPELSLVAAGKGRSEELVLARLSRGPRGAVVVDPSVRRPLAPAGTGGLGGAGAS
jgi:hypothetical protein